MNSFHIILTLLSAMIANYFAVISIQDSPPKHILEIIRSLKNHMDSSAKDEPDE